jgi:hypothetical protein
MNTILQKLYVRIWLAVVLAVAVLTLMVGWAWRMTTEPPLREVVVRNAQGDVIGAGHMRLGRRPDADGTSAAPPRAPASAVSESDKDEGEPESPGRFGRGPEFLVHMQD